MSSEQMKVEDWIKERRTIHGKAQSEGAWWMNSDGDVMHHYEYGEEDDVVAEPLFVDDAAAIVDAHNTLPTVLTALEKVLELHQPVEVEPSDTICKACSNAIGAGDTLRYMPTEEWPCPTVQKLQEAINDDE